MITVITVFFLQPPTLPNPPQGGDFYDNLVYFITVALIIGWSIKEYLANRKKKTDPDVYEEIARLWEEIGKSKKKADEAEARAEAAEARAEAAEVENKKIKAENKEIKERLSKVESENKDLIAIVSIASPAINKILSETTAGLNIEKMKRYHDLLNKYNLLINK